MATTTDHPDLENHVSAPAALYRTLSGEREPLVEGVGVTGELASHRVVILLAAVLLLQLELALLQRLFRCWLRYVQIIDR